MLKDKIYLLVINIQSVDKNICGIGGSNSSHRYGSGFERVSKVVYLVVGVCNVAWFNTDQVCASDKFSIQ